MDEFCVRLLSFYERGADGKPGRWPHPALAPEAMAGAGFRLQGSQVKSGDNVICDFCRLQAWKWETKDDPFQQHQDASPKCAYVASAIFGQHREVFSKKQLDKGEAGSLPLTPPATPAKRSYTPRRRVGLSPIVTVYESAPAGQAAPSSLKRQKAPVPMEISVTTGEINFVIQMSEVGEPGNKRLRLE
ncbi:death-associated inhibitor of apoptosis 2 [Colletotrichum spaethianum]|uniref:Death-associated inhibitor of apoptosis 2 n=1 Tax=Colletotrichum spaethianum TaxID=700344 RepID=A0AA37LDF2_9PEZI|nr:death-associated inhibitor of apoptosis 2 [Colletotrichum spaethianum]GKT46306.1 death-associated inhibitor of apoptosis 2 [Colletotrichum spaethianum]